MGSLYEQDFIAWTEQQARALRDLSRTSNAPLDWEHLIAEIESLGASERRALGSEVRRVIQHLLKLEHSREMDPRRGWQVTVVNARAEIEALLAHDPGLRARLTAVIAEEWPRAARAAAQELRAHGQAGAAAAAARAVAGYYTERQLLGDWFPDTPAP